ncbi:phage holin family protein [Qipengyuania sediminis]|uniref:phage holin family protein n=1 Tax=Qipengyuania sediminis TaxID=1532023 RepID=UPI001404948E|nr:phage holin family protein [Qipengyuania sediminis]
MDRAAAPFDPVDDDPAAAFPSRQDASLKDDVTALIADGKTYLQAEIAFQKSRAGYSAGQLKSATIYGAGALALIHLALVALTVGLVFALATLVGPWLATGIVVLVLLAGAGLFALAIRKRVAAVQSLFGKGES